METLPLKHSANGWNYKLVDRNEAGAIYSQSRHPDLPDGGKASAYEVILIQFRPARILGTQTLPAREGLPSDIHWGKKAWTCHTLERARQKFAEVSTPERIAAARIALAKIAA